MGYSGFKGIGPNKIGARKGGAVSPAKMYGGKKGDESKSKLDYESPAKQTAKQKANLPKQIVDAIAAKQGKSPVKQKAGYVKHKTLTVKGKPLEYNPKFDPKKLITDQSEARDKKSLKKKSPAKKMNKGMKYDIKEASNQSLSKSARKHYAENAQAANKGGYGNKEKGSPAKQKKVNRADGVQVKEVPKVVKEEVGKAKKKVGNFIKKVGKKVGNITLTKTKKEKIKKAQEKLKKLKRK